MREGAQRGSSYLSSSESLVGACGSNLTAMTEVHCGPLGCGLISRRILLKDRAAAGSRPERKAERTMSTHTTGRASIAKRRSSRIALNATVGLSGQDRHKCPFTMPATATNLNRHGAAVQLPRELLVGSTITVRNPRGTQISARVVSQLSASQGLSAYAIEFTEFDDAAHSFWGIAFPPLANRAAIAEQAAAARRRRSSSS